ncbi:MAG: hypothetical protein HYY65_05705 [Candidatus Tectomicrobia bacterium]|uniref:Uncharacterized protein n=1 Tax=Tectimicrobiota bacterium TaxID=2528274 RepID=A0A932GP39_UNCTE|nr:hypothetical protein [Candidatus Tectomicrobia bacterium]
MLLQELRAEFNEYFQLPGGQLILWLDPGVQWRGVVPQLTGDFQVVTYQGSQLEVKAAVELAWARKERPRFVLYLPGLSAVRLNVLKEYEFCGKVYEESILQALRRWDVEFDRAHEPELEKILPIAVRHLAHCGNFRRRAPTRSSATLWPRNLEGRHCGIQSRPSGRSSSQGI